MGGLILAVSFVASSQSSFLTMILFSRSVICLRRWLIGSALTMTTGTVFAAGPSTLPARIEAVEAVATFESIGVYLTVAGPMQDLTAELAWRAAGTETWNPALAPVAYEPDRQFRGSVLLLKADTAYEVRARLRLRDTVLGEATTAVRTWLEKVPIAREVILPAGVSTAPLVITERGTPEGWILYRAAPTGSTIAVGAGAPSALVLDHAAYVIVEGLTLRGGDEHAVHVVDSHDVRIRHCDIAAWGGAGTWAFHEGKKQWAYLNAAGKIIDRQAGVRVRGAASQRVVVEGNLIHHPRGTAANWAFEHPHGPSGIVLSETGGNNVVRHNDLIAGDGHRWNDTIESEYNGRLNGGPHRDTDISGNLLVGANDDGTELDGGQMNVRYWHNWIEGGLCGVSCAPNIRGPSYVFRNLIVTSDDRGASGAGFKMGGDEIPNPGVSFLLQNTVFTNNYGLTSGHYGKGPTPMISRHNIFAGPGGGHGRLRLNAGVSGDLDEDLVPVGGLLGPDVPREGREAHAVMGRAQFVSVDERDFRLQPGSPGTGAASVALPNLGGRNFGAVPATDSVQSWPIRAGAPQLLPNRHVVRVRRGQTAEFTLRVDSGKSWRAEAGEPWLRVAADAAAGKLLCAIDGKDLSVGTHRTFVSVRAADGGLRSVPVVVEVEPETALTFRVEAETLTRPSPFELKVEAGASGGVFLEVSSTTPRVALEFEFETETAGDFFVLARVRAAGPVASLATQDSIDLQLDDGPVMRWDLFGISTDDWTWIVAHPKEHVDGRFRLAAGRHRFSLYGKETQVQVDALVISNSPFAP